MSPRNARLAAGFTLVEVVVALAILSVIGMLSFGALSGALQARDYLESSDEVDRSARMALARISREIRLAFLTANTGASSTYKTVFIGKDGDPSDQIWFATMAHRRSLRDAREGDQAEVTIWAEPDPHGEGGELALLHREAGRIDEEPDKQGVVLPLATGVTRFDLRYLDAQTGEWRDEWDTTSVDTPNRLPRAVQIVLVLTGPDPNDEDRTLEHPYLTTVLIERGERMVPKNKKNLEEVL